MKCKECRKHENEEITNILEYRIKILFERYIFLDLESF